MRRIVTRNRRLPRGKKERKAAKNDNDPTTKTRRTNTAAHGNEIGNRSSDTLKMKKGRGKKKQVFDGREKVRRDGAKEEEDFSLGLFSCFPSSRSQSTNSGVFFSQNGGKST